MLRVGLCKGLVDKPGTFVVLDIGTNLANDFGGAIAVKVVILNLEIFAKRNQDIVGLLEGVSVLDTDLYQEKR